MKKKILSLLLVAVMLVFQLVLPASAYDTGALDNALAELVDLNTSANKTAAYLLVGYVLTAIKNHEVSNALTAEDLYSIIKTQYNSYYANQTPPITPPVAWVDIINENSTPETNKIEKANVIILLEQAILRENLIKSYYDVANDIYYELTHDVNGAPNTIGTAIKAKLQLDSSAPNSAVYAAMLTVMGPIFTLNASNEFVLAEDESALENILETLNIGVTIEFVNSIYPGIESKINSKINLFLDKINEYIALYELTQSNINNIANVLDTFGLYKDSTPVPTPTPTTPPGGGTSTTPSPSPSTAPIDNNTTPEEVKTYIDDKAKAIETAKDTAAAVEIVKDVINETKTLLAAPAASSNNTAAAVKASVTQLIDKVMAKVNTETVAPTVTGTTAKAVVSATATTDILAKLDTIVSTANTIKSSLDAAGADIKVEKVLKIEAASTNTGVKAADVEIPTSIFTAAKDKAIDKIAIDTGIATINIAPDALSVSGSEKVTLTTSVVDKSMLPEDVQAAVGNETVYDFNAFVGDTKVSEFKKKLEISVPYTLKPGENPKKVTVFYINDKGQLENIIGKYDEATSKVSFTTKHFSGYVVKYNNITFNDIAVTEWARTEIESMAAKGIIQGVGNDKFAPQSKLTRAQFATMIVNAFKLQNTTVQNVFTDVKDTDWFYDAVLSAYATGIINGTTTTTFSPNAYISRQDMAVMISRALVLLYNTDAAKDRSASITSFPDKTSISDYAIKGVEITAYYGIMIGNAQGKLNPKGNATRAEAAIVLYRLFNIVG